MVWLDTQTVECMYIVYSVLCSIRSTYNLCTIYISFQCKKNSRYNCTHWRRQNQEDIIHFFLHISIILCNTNMLRKNSCQNLLPKSDTASSRSRIEHQIELRTQPYVMTEFRNFQRKKAFGCIVCAFRLQMTRRFFWQQIFHRRNLNIWQISPYAGLAE